ncbi:MAG: hypothetical protein C0429_11820 [Sphingopyxis sp.]|nr:hypothetical protein [Sphingopyxis sp.]
MSDMLTRNEKMDRTKIFAGLLAVSLTSAALYAAPGMKADADGDKNVTKAEALAQADARFAKMDANGDGTLNSADRTAMAKKHFAEMDADKNGSINESEFMAAHEARLAARRDRHVQRMDKANADAGGERRERHVGGHGRSGMKMLALADTNGDKAVTQAEFRKAAETRFAKADTNNDGTISAAERKSMRKDRGDRPPPPTESGME